MTTRIVRNRDILHNAPRIDGTRIPTAMVYELIQAGFTTTQIAMQYPTLTPNQIMAAWKYETSPRRRIGRRVDELKVRLIRWLDESWGY